LVVDGPFHMFYWLMLAKCIWKGGIMQQSNKNYSNKKRILVIEHTICRLKKHMAISNIFRNRLRKYNRISDIVAGLANYRTINQCL
jgi:hypothetical protein